MKYPRYIPNGYTLFFKDEKYGLEIYAQLSPKIVAICYGGKRSKSDWHYRFKDLDGLKKQVDEVLLGYQIQDERKQKQKDLLKKPNTVKVGDIFTASWGYDQTNIDYYQCTKVIGQMIEIREIRQSREGNGYMTGTCVPVPNAFIGEPMRKKVNMSATKPCVRITSFCHAYLMEPIVTIAGKQIFEEYRWTAYA